MIYGSEEQAFRRVETLKQRGVWPGVRRVFGGWELTYDPADLSEPVPDLPSAPNSELGWERRHTQRSPQPSRGNLTKAPRTPSPMPGVRMLP